MVSADVDDPHAILVRSADLHGMEIPEALLAVGRAGSGTNNIPIPKMSARGIPVFNAPGANANAVKELVVGGMLLAARNIDDAVGVANSPAGNAVRQLNAFFVEGSIAVGSWTGGVRDGFSNCGEWVNGIAGGAGVTSRYPSRSTWAKWGGTSFATPKVTAALVGGAGLFDVQLDASGSDVGGC